MKTKEEYYTIIKRNVVYYRKERGMTQKTLSESVGLSRTHISNLEAPNIMKLSISLDSLIDIAQVLELPVEKLFVE